MNNKLFCAITIVFVWLFAASNAHAIFPRRFGCAGGCAPHVVQHHAPAAVIERRDILQNFFIGLAPTQLDSPRGTTFYARDLASEVVLASDLDYINLSKQFLSSATDVAATARSVRPGLEAIAAKNADANLKLATGEAAANVIRSFGGDTSGTAKTVVMTLRNGKLETFQELQATQAEVPAVDPAPVPRDVESEPEHSASLEIFKSKCTSCHSAAGKARNAAYKDLREFDGEISDDDIKAALARINSKDKKLRMPKGGNALTLAEKEPLYQELMARMK